MAPLSIKPCEKSWLALVEDDNASYPKQRNTVLCPFRYGDPHPVLRDDVDDILRKLGISCESYRYSFDGAHLTFKNTKDAAAFRLFIK